MGAAGQTMISLNGTSVTGISLGGMTPSGSALNGATLTSVATAGAGSNGLPLIAISVLGPPLSGTTPVGSRWTGTASTGASVSLRIESAQSGAAPNGELWSYAVSYETSTGWRPLCGVDAANVPIRAVAVAGVWSTIVGDTASYGASATRFTLACQTKTVAKCVELGYKPYEGLGIQLASCVRMLRGDYCGTGTPYTVDGTTLNLYDNVGVQSDDEAWLPEAEWTPSGARCVNPDNTARYELAVSKDPKCVRALEASGCGASFANGAVLIDELPPN